MAKGDPVRPAFDRLMDSSSVRELYAVRSGKDPLTGQHVVDVRDPTTGYYADGCQVVGFGVSPIPAPQERWDGVIDFTKHPQVIGLFTHPNKKPYILGVITTNAVLQDDVKDSGQRVGSTGTTRDHIVQNGTGRIIVKEDGRIVLEGVGSHVEVVTRSGGTMRVGDAESGDAAALSGPVHEALAALHSAVTSLQEWARALTIVVPLTGPGTPALPYTTAAPTLPDLGDIQSAVLKVSTKAVSDGA